VLNSSTIEIMLLAAAALAIILALLLRNRLPSNIVYLDTTRSKVFESQVYKIKAKPDELSYEVENELSMTEYKSRESGVYPSDRAQMIATAIAVRESGHDVSVGYLQTGNGKRHKVNLSGSTEQLYSKIALHAKNARLASKGIEPEATPFKFKCNSCAYRTQCPHSVA